MSEWSDNWDDLDTWDDLEADEGGSSRTRVWIISAIVGVVLLLLVWYVWVVALLNPDNYRLSVDLTSPWQGGEAEIGSGASQGSAWLAFWIGFHVLMQVVGLVLIVRRRHTMSTRLVVKWSLLILLVPVAGVLGYYFYLLEGAIQRGVPGRQEEPASFLRSPRQRM